MSALQQGNGCVIATAAVFPCNDGVFSNLNAKPEVIRIENLDYEDKPPPYYECVMNMPPAYQEAIDDSDVLSSITIDGQEVGSGSVFVLHCLIGVLFHVIGVVAGLLLGNTHAGRYGSLSALGILMLILSLTVEDNHNLKPNTKAVLSPILFIGGYILFMTSLFLFQRVQDKAKEIYRSNYTIHSY